MFLFTVILISFIFSIFAEFEASELAGIFDLVLKFIVLCIVGLSLL